MLKMLLLMFLASARGTVYFNREITSQRTWGAHRFFRRARESGSVCLRFDLQKSSRETSLLPLETVPLLSPQKLGNPPPPLAPLPLLGPPQQTGFSSLQAMAAKSKSSAGAFGDCFIAAREAGEMDV